MVEQVDRSGLEDGRNIVEQDRKVLSQRQDHVRTAGGTVSVVYPFLTPYIIGVSFQRTYGRWGAQYPPSTDRPQTPSRRSLKLGVTRANPRRLLSLMTLLRKLGN